MVEPERPTCVESGCDRPAVVRGVCQKHYQQRRRAGRTKQAPKPAAELPTPVQRLLSQAVRMQMAIRAARSALRIGKPKAAEQILDEALSDDPHPTLPGETAGPS